MPEDMCKKKCSGSIISRRTIWMTGFTLYPSSDTEKHQLTTLHKFFGLNELQEVYYVISCSWSHAKHIYIFMNEVG